MRLRAPGGMIRVLSTHRIHTFNLPACWRCSAKDSSSKHQSLQAYSLDCRFDCASDWCARREVVLITENIVVPAPQRGFYEVSLAGPGARVADEEFQRGWRRGTRRAFAAGGDHEFDNFR